jgi:hypothetical protein
MKIISNPASSMLFLMYAAAVSVINTKEKYNPTNKIKSDLIKSN